MALSERRMIYGVHCLTPYSRTTGLPYGTFNVLKGSSLALNGELNKLNGGSQKYPWAVEEGLINAELSLKVSELPDFAFELFMGKAPTAVTTDATGTVSTLANKNGTSCMQASTGVASVGIIPSTGAANLKFGRYVLKVASATTVDIYLSSDIDAQRGTDVEYQNDTLKIISAAQTITSGANTDIASLGLRLAGGSGTIGMTTSDTATFEVKPPSTQSMSVRIGATSDTFTEFGAWVYSKRRSNNEMFEVDLFRCKAAGMPLGFEMNAWSESDLKAEAFYDSTLNGVYDIRYIKVT